MFAEYLNWQEIFIIEQRKEIGRKTRNVLPILTKLCNRGIQLSTKRLSRWGLEGFILYVTDEGDACIVFVITFLWENTVTLHLLSKDPMLLSTMNITCWYINSTKPQASLNWLLYNKLRFLKGNKCSLKTRHHSIKVQLSFF